MNVMIRNSNSNARVAKSTAEDMVSNIYYLPQLVSEDAELVDYLNGLLLLKGRQAQVLLLSDLTSEQRNKYYCLVDRLP